MKANQKTQTLFLSLFVAVFLLGLQSITRAQSSFVHAGSFLTGAMTQGDDQARTNRLAEIAAQLRDKKRDGVALLTEAVRLCGFSIWKEDRSKVAEPLTTPGLGLAITDSEIAGYLELFRRGDRVEVADVVTALDPMYRSLGGQKGLGTYVEQLLQSNMFNARPANRALAVFLQELGRTHEVATDAPMALTSRFDAVQILLVFRVLTEEMGVPLRQWREEEARETFVSLEPAWAEAEAPGWAEDAFAGGVTGLFGEIAGRLGDVGEKVSGAVGKINALSGISKFILTYKFLKGEITLEGKGQPLIRTKDFDAGDERTTVAKFYIDGAGVTDWLKENRRLFHAIGIDPDMPKSGPLKNVETYWAVGQDQKYATKQLIQAVRGTTDLSRLKTNDNGEAKVTWEGKPQPKKIDPKKAMPVMKSVWISVAPQVKSVEMQQDLVDAIGAAIGIKDGMAGLLTPTMEILYRMKWHAPAHFELQIKDWVEGDTAGQLTVEAKGSGHSFGRDRSSQMSIDHTLTISNVSMLVTGAEAYPQIDPDTMKKYPPDVRKQIEAGMKEAAEAAKKRRFDSTEPGTATLSINDSAFYQTISRDCTVSTLRSTETWRGATTVDMKRFGSDFGFSVDANLEKKVAILKYRGKVKGTYIGESSQWNSKKELPFDMMTNISIDSELMGKNGEITMPLKETPLVGQPGFNYNGTVNLKFKFGPGNAFTGTMIVSYSVTRKMPPKAPAKPKKR